MSLMSSSGRIDIYFKTPGGKLFWLKIRTLFSYKEVTFRPPLYITFFSLILAISIVKICFKNKRVICILSSMVLDFVS